MNIDRLFKILDETTTQYRKGEQVVVSKIGEAGRRIEVVELYNMAHVDQAPVDAGVDLVDVEFLTIAVDKAAAERNRAELLAILREWPEPARLAGGPSYMEVGGVVGDQGAAFQLFALGQTLGLWKVMTPKDFGYEGDEVQRVAGMGYIFIATKPGFLDA
jgi:hypothetical protein